MIIKEATGFGATVEEAKEKALQSLNASDTEEVQIEVVSIAKKKVLGLFGGSQAEVHAYVEGPDPAPAKKSAPKKEKSKKEPKNKQETPAPKAEKKVQKPVAEYSEPVDAATLPADSDAAKAVAYIQNVLNALECKEVSIRVATRENAAMILIDGEDLSILIGRRGETLDSLQYLAGLAANSGGGHYKISINIGSYREKREETLVALANRLAAQALESGKCRTLEPMNPYERRIIHTAVQAIEGVESASFGEGTERRVVIAPTGVEMHPRMNRSHGGRNKNGGNHRGGNRRGGRRDSQKVTPKADPNREPKRDTDLPLYGKIN